VEDVPTNQQEVVAAVYYDSEDAECDGDLTEQVARMDEVDEDAALAANSKPVTANEIVGADLAELQDQFLWNVVLETYIVAERSLGVLSITWWRNEPSWSRRCAFAKKYLYWSFTATTWMVQLQSTTFPQFYR
jgi:hypothetical protein